MFIAVERTLVATGNPNFVPSAILVGAAIVPAAFLTFVYGRSLAYDVGLPVVASAAFLGGVIGTVVAGTLEYDAQRDFGLLPMVGVGLIEETSKLLIPLGVLIFFRRVGWDGRVHGRLLPPLGCDQVNVTSRAWCVAALTGTARRDKAEGPS